MADLTKSKVSHMDVPQFLQQVKEGRLSIDEATQRLRQLPFEELGFAKLDHHRQLRTGYGEVIYCPGKTAGQLVEIVRHFQAAGTGVLGTRATETQFEAVKAACPLAAFDPVSRVLTVAPEQPAAAVGLVAVCTGGTGDLPVAEEAAQVAEFFGSRVERVYDIGVAGIHRLFARLETIRHASAIVAVAGMEGALGGVLAGLVEVPVIAVPTSVGYGASFGGIAPLLTMLNSCAEGMAVVNIDNGFGAGYLAGQINRLINRKKEI
nr:nickel pincer cofactor biosynthesis protein LarB [Victivallis sp. Marseille-Q1083]